MAAAHLVPNNIPEDLDRHNAVMYEDTAWRVRKINTKAGAMFYGANRGWCTSDTDSDDFETYYSPNKGQMYILWDKHKPRPQIQLFVSRRGEMEIRKKFNEPLGVMAFKSMVTDALWSWLEGVLAAVRPTIEPGYPEIRSGMLSVLEPATPRVDFTDTSPIAQAAISKRDLRIVTGHLSETNVTTMPGDILFRDIRTDAVYTPGVFVNDRGIELLAWRKLTTHDLFNWPEQRGQRGCKV